MPRIELTIAKKYELLCKIESYPPNTTKTKLAKHTGVSRDTIRRLLRSADKIKEEWSMNDGKPPSSQKRKRIGLYPDIDEALYNWFSLVQAHGERITRVTLQRKAKELAQSMNRYDFKATDGWVFRWKRRHEIGLKQALTDGNSIFFKRPVVDRFNKCAKEIHKIKVISSVSKHKQQGCGDSLTSSCNTELTSGSSTLNNKRYKVKEGGFD